MVRTASETRPDELLDAVADYLAKHGAAGLSLRPLAKAVGSSPRVLLYYFGSKEEMLSKALARSRERQRGAFAEILGGQFATAPEARPGARRAMTEARAGRRRAPTPRWSWPDSADFCSTIAPRVTASGSIEPSISGCARSTC